LNNCWALLKGYWKAIGKRPKVIGQHLVYSQGYWKTIGKGPDNTGTRWGNVPFGWCDEKSGK
jgi:hypothetical protein